jgi:hypothetical protein
MGGACNTMEKSRGARRVLLGKPMERDHVEDLDVDGKL